MRIFGIDGDPVADYSILRTCRKAVVGCPGLPKLGREARQRAFAEVAELADALRSGRSEQLLMGVQIPPSALSSFLPAPLPPALPPFFSRTPEAGTEPPYVHLSSGKQTLIRPGLSRLFSP